MVIFKTVFGGFSTSYVFYVLFTVDNALLLLLSLFAQINLYPKKTIISFYSMQNNVQKKHLIDLIPDKVGGQRYCIRINVVSNFIIILYIFLSFYHDLVFNFIFKLDPVVYANHGFFNRHCTRVFNIKIRILNRIWFFENVQLYTCT